MNPNDFRMIEKFIEEVLKFKPLFNLEWGYITYKGAIDKGYFLSVSMTPDFVILEISVEGETTVLSTPDSFSEFGYSLKDYFHTVITP